MNSDDFRCFLKVGSEVLSRSWAGIASFFWSRDSESTPAKLAIRVRRVCSRRESTDCSERDEVMSYTHYSHHHPPHHRTIISDTAPIHSH